MTSKFIRVEARISSTVECHELQMLVQGAWLSAIELNLKWMLIQTITANFRGTGDLYTLDTSGLIERLDAHEVCCHTRKDRCTRQMQNKQM